LIKKLALLRMTLMFLLTLNRQCTQYAIFPTRTNRDKI
jgi:hypothetical protein